MVTTSGTMLTELCFGRPGNPLTFEFQVVTVASRGENCAFSLILNCQDSHNGMSY